MTRKDLPAARIRLSPGAGQSVGVYGHTAGRVRSADNLRLQPKLYQAADGFILTSLKKQNPRAAISASMSSISWDVPAGISLERPKAMGWPAAAPIASQTEPNLVLAIATG